MSPTNNYETQKRISHKEPAKVYNTIQPPLQIIEQLPPKKRAYVSTINTGRDDSNMRSRKRSQQPIHGTVSDRNRGGATGSTSRQRAQRIKPDLNFTSGDPVEAYNTNTLNLPFELLANDTSESTRTKLQSHNISATLKQKLSTLIQQIPVQSDRTQKQQTGIVNVNQSAQPTINTSDSLV